MQRLWFFGVHGEDVKLLLAGASLRFNNPTTATEFHIALTSAFHRGMLDDNGAQYLAKITKISSPTQSVTVSQPVS